MIKVGGQVLEESIGTTIRVEERDEKIYDDCRYQHLVTAYYFIKGDPNEHSAYVDSTEDVKIDCDYNEYVDWFNNTRLPYVLARKLEKHHREVNYIAKGREVVVVKGRKVPVGTKGNVFWLKVENFSYVHYNGWQSKNGETTMERERDNCRC